MQAIVQWAPGIILGVFLVCLGGWFLLAELRDRHAVANEVAWAKQEADAVVQETLRRMDRAAEVRRHIHDRKGS